RTYQELIGNLTEFGFHQHQYSDYCCPNTAAEYAFVTALWLSSICLPSKLSTTVRGLKIHYISDLNLLDITCHVKLGGNVARKLAGPAPRQLAQRLEFQAIQAGQNLSAPPQPVLPGHPGVPPFATRRNQQTLNVANYLM
ncbi:hypothetical protein GY45DRAFT_1415757, partial [Cubamyces sp. BRFM 1775]